MIFKHDEFLSFEKFQETVLSYNSKANIDLLKKGYDYAEKKHQGQKRVSGENYIIHPLHVAYYAALLKMDEETLVSCFLHDVIEDSEVTKAELEFEFNKNIAEIVEACTKVSKIIFKDSKNENFKKMFIAMAKDFRVIIVKILDRLHNMKTLRFLHPEKRLMIAKETLEVYVPLTARLGLQIIKNELEDLSFYYTNTPAYYRLSEKVAMKKIEREQYILFTAQELSDHLRSYGIDGIITGRSKNLFSIYKKMKKREVDFEQIQDLLAFRILVNNITECYKTLGIIHSEYTPIPGRFKDYIAIPKANKYQSLHTTIMGPKTQKIEIQIRTHEMQEVAERGIAAHWYYKDNGSVAVKKSWLDDLLEDTKLDKEDLGLLSKIKEDFHQKSVFVFTPQGDIKELPQNATILDFAYAIHSDIGHHCEGGKINNKMMPLKTKLKTGDIVEIHTNKNQQPSKDWLKIAKTSRAINKINQWFLKEDREKQQASGEKILEKALKSENLTVKILEKKQELKILLDQAHVQTLEELYYLLGSGKIALSFILQKLPFFALKEEVKETITPLKESSFKKENSHFIIVDHLQNIETKLSKCCLPIPFDDIICFVTKNHGITVHREQCPRVQEFEKKQEVFAEWNPQYQNLYETRLKIMTQNNPGVMADLSKSLERLKVNIVEASIKSLSSQTALFLMMIQVKNDLELSQVMSQLSLLPTVITIERV